MQCRMLFLGLVIAGCGVTEPPSGSGGSASDVEAIALTMGGIYTSSNFVGDGTAQAPLDLASKITFPAANLTFGVAPAPLPPAPTITEDWDPWGTGKRTSLVRVVTAQKGSILGGLVGGKVGDIVILENHGDGSGSYGAGDLKIVFRRTNDVTSSVANHIYQPNLTDIVIPYTGAIVLYYDATNVGWIPISMSVGGKFERIAVDEISIAHPLSPPALAAGVLADFDPPGGQFGSGQKTASWLRLKGDPAGGTQISGIVPYYQSGPGGIAAQGPIKIIENLGGPLTLLSEDASSEPTHRFAFPNGSIVIPPNGIQILLYDTQGGGVVNQARWRTLSSTGMFSKLTLYRAVTDSALPPVLDDYCPPSFDQITRLRLTPATFQTQLGGMCAQEDGAIRTITAFGRNLTLRHLATSSAAGNRVFMPGQTDYTLPVGGSVTLVYDNQFHAWFVLARS